MNILVIGNGFDLAHGLPTKYTDFLEMMETFQNLINTPAIMKSGGLDNIEKPKYAYLDKLIFENLDLSTECERLLIKNIWIEYFFQCDMHGSENWIDFESEISEVIKSIDSDMVDKGLYEKIISLSNKFLNNKYTNNTPEYLAAMSRDEQEKIEKEPILFKELRDELITDLGRLIRLFEIYLTDYIEKINCEYISPDIRDIEVDKVLSFNYTNTYEKLYGANQSIEYDYIHGKANIENTVISNNMVLGIDEYLPDDRKDRDIDFIAFKKFYQRIHKQTGCKYREWVDEIITINSNYLENINSCKEELKINKGLGK